MMDLEMYEEEVMTEVTDSVGFHETETECAFLKCLFCKRETSEHVADVDKGLPTLLKHLEAIGRSDLVNDINVDNKNKAVKLHLSCRRKLAYEAAKAERVKADEVVTPKRASRSSAVGLSFKDMCFLCGSNILGSKDVRKVMSGLEFDYKIKQVIQDRCFDDWALAVQGRMSSVSDLFAADAMYHKGCYTRFVTRLPHTPSKKRRGRPQNLEALQAFSRLCEKLENECENEMYTLTELFHIMVNLAEECDEDGSIYGKKYLKELLQQRYGVHIYFVSRPGRDDVVGFTNYCELLLHDKYFADRNEGQGSAAERVVQKAAGLIMAEIREMTAQRDYYPSNDDITCDGSTFLAPLLRQFLERLIQAPLKVAGLGQGIMQAARPRSFLMPLLHSVGVEADHSGGEKFHTQLSRLGYSLSHDEVRRYKHSIIHHKNVCCDAMKKNSAMVEPLKSTPPTTTAFDLETGPSVNVSSHLCTNSVTATSSVEKDVCIASSAHFVADNVDHNIRTIDGDKTFHGMGIIVATPSLSRAEERIPRLDKPQKVSELFHTPVVKIVPFKNYDCSGISTLELQQIRTLRTPVHTEVFSNLNVLWHAVGRISSEGKPRPNWSGFMQTICCGNFNGFSTIEMLEIIDLNPSDDSCIYSTMLYVIDQAKSRLLPTPSLTFDQPLYIKAVDIAMKANLNIVIRLGGFHTLMSFLGSIGHMMRGSGIEEIMGLLFGSTTTEYVLSGKAYARAVRGHFIVHGALSDLLLDHMKNPLSASNDSQPVAMSLDDDSSFAGVVSPSDFDELVALYDKLLLEKVWIGQSETALLTCDSLSKLCVEFDRFCSAVSDKSRTARLWFLYMKYVTLLKLFIFGERTGNWNVHLHAVEGMLGLFAATGHINYAKSARLYVQQMKSLASNPMTESVNAQFESGNHSIRRTNRFWAGLSTDLVIEQTMMRSIKSRGGLTRGRGMHETSRETWLATLSTCAGVRAALDQVIGKYRCTTDHIDVGKSRMQRDFKDFSKVKSFLSVYSPFRFVDNEHLVSLCSGVAAGSEDQVNCDQSDVIGWNIQEQWDGSKYGDIACKKSNQIKTLAHLINSCEIDKSSVLIDPIHLFHRLVLVGERESNLRECFEFELTPYPMSLFKDGLMRKPDKPSLYTDFTRGLNAFLPSGTHFVVDGGYLLHKVRWKPSMNVVEVLNLFRSFLLKYGSGTHVVFDGYSCGPTIKDQEHARRSMKSSQVSPHRHLDMNSKDIGLQEPFLSNKTNKAVLIDLLMPYLQLNGFVVAQAPSDADSLIVSVALDCATLSSVSTVAVLAEDTDVLVLLLHHRKPTMRPIYFVSEAKKGRGGKLVGGKCLNVGDVQERIGVEACDRMLVVHALGGCDSTSAIFGLGKGTIHSRIQADKTGLLHTSCMALLRSNATDAEVVRAGTNLLISLYGGKVGDRLADLRYEAYCKMSLSRRFKPERLPPSEGAAHLHVRRVHLQAVIWGTLGKTVLKETDWGWESAGSCLKPIKIVGDIAPQSVLKFVRCNCRGNCSSKLCSCRQNNIHCVSACGNCHGTDCSNGGVTSDEKKDSGSESDEESFDKDLAVGNVDPPLFLFDEDLDFFYEEEI